MSKYPIIDLDNHVEDKYNAGGAGVSGGTSAGSPGVSSAGAMGGSTNKGLRSLPKNADERARAFALKQLRKNK